MSDEMTITIKVDKDGQVILITDPPDIAIEEAFFWMEAAKFGVLNSMGSGSANSNP